MKRIIIILLILINIFLINFTTIINHETMMVIDLEDNIFDVYKLKTTVNTKIILNYINDEIKILAITPKISINLSSKLNQYIYRFNQSSNQNNLLSFEKEFRKLLIKESNVKEANLINFDGIDIEEIVIYTNETNLDYLIHTGKFILE